MSLEKIIKLKKLEKLIKSSAKDELKDYKTTVFEGRTFSKIQKYLKSIEKSANIPPLVKRESGATTCDKDKAELFNNYFVSVFNDQDKIRITSKNASLSTVNCLKCKICLALKTLKHGKSTGPDRIENLVLQKCHPLIGKSLALIFQTYVNKGKNST